MTRRLFRYLLREPGRLTVAVVSMLLLAVTTGLYPVLLDLLTTSLVEGSEETQLAFGPLLERSEKWLETLGFSLDSERLTQSLRYNIVALFVVVVGAKTVSQMLRFYAMGALAQSVVHTFRGELFGAIVSQSAGFFKKEQSGQLVSRMMNDVTSMERAVTYALPILLGDVMKVVVIGAVCIIQYPELSVATVIILPLAVVPIYFFGRSLKRYGRQSQIALGDLTHRITETLGGMDVVRAYGGEQWESKRFEKDSQVYTRIMMRDVRIRAIQTPAMELIGVAVVVGTILFASQQVDSGALRPGGVVGFLFGVTLFYEPIKAIARSSGIIMPGIAAAERVFEIIDRRREVVDEAGAQPISGKVRTVALEQVRFRYGEAAEWVLDDVSIALEPGRALALVGPSGAGKSTIVSLLLRLYDPEEGRVTVNGQDIRAFTLESLRQQISLVSQDNFLFNDSIRANIAYGCPRATHEAVQEAARRARAHDFILGLPGGYDSVVGERGLTLSGGQRQRIAIARAFLRDAPIVVLDEATSALDVESEREVQAALDALFQDRAILVIAHRMATVRKADQIVFLKGGRIVESGTHEGLVKNGAAYAHWVSIDEGRHARAV
jgi:ATP-binding cassette, subfamily B, bacterial MsbA